MMNSLRKQGILEKLGAGRPLPPAPSPQDTIAARTAFLKKKGYSKVPKNKKLEFIVPLQEGGAAHIGNLRLVEKVASRQKAVREYLQLLNSKSLTKAQKLELHRYGMPTFASTATWGLTGAALAPKGERKKAFSAGLGVGLVRPAMWKALGKTYAKGVKLPYSELIK